MDQDKALKKILDTAGKSDLPDGFEDLLMDKIMLEVRKKKKRSTISIFSLVSAVSVAMITGTVFLFKNYLSVRISLPVPDTHLSVDTGYMFGFYFYIAFLVLILLGIDHYFRNLKHKPED
ncbi:MAG: hypothetical protein PHR38_06850 [Bacteroidales bacterium]|nr:hypothetical protein [Bacteroidales bacterium]MDD4712600.1 hypothetical protein [Bacteroidales bacterium]